MKSKIEDIDSEFLLNKTTYPKDFLPQYVANDIVPERIFQTAVILPFQIPFKNGTCITMHVDNNTMVTLAFSYVNTINRLAAGLSGVAAKDIPVKKSKVELNYISKDKDLYNKSRTEIDILSLAFDTCIEHLNFFISAYLTSSKDFTVYKVSKEMFEFACYYRIIEVDKWRFKPTLFLLTNNAPYIKPDLSDEEEKRIVIYARQLKTHNNPFVVSEELLLDSKRNLHNGFYSESVIFSQTAVESFLKTLYFQILLTEGCTDAEIALKAEELSFSTLFKRKLHEKLGGKWDISDSRSTVAKWYTHAYCVRNEVVHGAHYATYKEAEVCHERSVEFIMYCRELLKAKKKKYPGIWHYFSE